MNQKKCPQCKNLISASSPTCLYCGRPNKFVTKNYVKEKWKRENSKNNKIIEGLVPKCLIIIFVVLFITLLIYL